MFGSNLHPVSKTGLKSFLYKVSHSKPIIIGLLFALIVTSVVVISSKPAKSSSYTFVQTSWAGGLSGGTYPAHPGDQTSFTKYESKDSTVTAGTTVTLASQSSSVAQTSTDFSGGTLTTTAVSGGSLKLTSSGNNSAWSTLTPSGTAPTIRKGAGSAWDPVGLKMYVFGGDSSGSTVNDLFSYTPSTNTWATLSPSGSAPSARHGFTMEWDTLNSRVLIFGGQTSASGSSNGQNDMYSYTPSSNAWASISALGTKPTARWDMAHGWDSVNNKMYVYGGTDNFSSQNNDLFSYNVVNNTWTSIGTSSSLGRAGFSGAFDSANGKFYIFGGNRGASSSNELLAYTVSGNSWATLSTGGPSARTASVSVWDPTNTKMYNIGGSLNTSFTYYNTLYSYNPSGNTWSTVSTTGTAQTARDQSTGVFDSSASRFYLFGGYNSGTYYNDLKLYDAGSVYNSSGNLVSSIIDLGQKSTVGNLTYSATTPTNTTAKFQIRSSTTSGGVTSATWYGPTGTGDFYTSSGTAINSIHNGDRYFQYKAFLDTTDTSVTPSVTGVTIGYSYYAASATLTNSAYNSGDSGNVLAKLQWSATTPTGTAVKFQARSAPNSAGVPGTWSSWVGPDGTSGTYFTDSSGGEATPAVLTTNSQWFQAKAFLTTTDGTVYPTLSGLTLTYVVNSAPVVSNLSAAQGSNGRVTVSYDLADSDNSTETVTLAADLGITLSGSILSGATSLVVSSGTYLPSAGSIFIGNEEIAYASKTGSTLNSLSRGQNNSTAAAQSNGATVWLKAVTVSGSVGASISLGTSKTITWIAPTDLTSYNSTAIVKVIANDGNVANQFGSASSSSFNLDTTPPTTQTASSVRAIANSDTAATITWTTDKASTSVVEYGTTISYGLTASDSNLVTSHSVALTGLAANTLYYYRVKSLDAVSNMLLDDNGGAGYSFTTPNIIPGSTIRIPPDTTAPTISGINVTEISATSAKIAWNTDEDATSVVYYGLTSGFGNIAGAPDIFTANHQVSISGLTANTTYMYKVVSLDGSGNKVSSTTASFITTTTTTGGTGTGSTADQIAALQNQIAALQTQKSSLETQITDLQSAIDALPADDPSIADKQTQLDTLETQYNQVVSDLSKAQSDLAALQNNANADAAGALQSQVDALKSQLQNTVSGSQFDAIKAQLEQAQRTLEQFNAMKKENETLKKQVGDLQDHLTYITNKILGILDGDTMSPEDLLQVVATKFTELAKSLKGKINIAQRKTVEASIADVNITLKDLTQLVPGTKILTSPTVEIISNTVTIKWLTDKAGTSRVSYADEAAYNLANIYNVQAGDETNYTLEHKVTLTNLLPSTTYHYSITSKTEAGVQTDSEDFTFTTKASSAVISAAKIIKLDENSTMIQWQTSIPASSAVNYTPIFGGVASQADAKTQGSPDFVKTHNVKLENLQRGSIYKVTINSADAFNNVVSLELGNFQTTADNIAPEITQLRPEVSVSSDQNSAKIQTIITWKTDKPSSTQVLFTKGSVTADKFSDATTINPEYTYSHTAVITNWDPGTMYSFRAVSKDQSGNEGKSKIFTVKTPQPKATVVDLIVNNFTGVFGWTKKLSK